MTVKNNHTVKEKKKITVKSICFTAVMAALIFVFTFTFKIPLGNGYTHLGDAIIFLSIPLLGSKKSCFAAGIGAALADVIGGYTIWAPPTFCIKLLLVLICGIFAEKLMKNKCAAFINKPYKCKMQGIEKEIIFHPLPDLPQLIFFYRQPQPGYSQKAVLNRIKWL